MFDDQEEPLESKGDNQIKGIKFQKDWGVGRDDHVSAWVSSWVDEYCHPVAVQ